MSAFDVPTKQQVVDAINLLTRQQDLELALEDGELVCVVPLKGEVMVASEFVVGSPTRRAFVTLQRMFDVLDLAGSRET